MHLKGVSPLIAAILLIAFTVAIAGILSVWLFGFAGEQTEIIKEEAERELICARARILLSDVKYCVNTSKIYGKIENIGEVLIGEIKVDIILENGTVLENPLCKVDNQVLKCENANLSLERRMIAFFNLSSSENYDIVRATTNCTPAHSKVRKDRILLAC